ncbi:hypothetical protein [Thalassobacillus pellis]|uniref:hypothetical protein n=1 Tax=Thalassobacillus pellis TaxID=748008 RepID=UPI0019619E2E|nr:hypothetical protein [Thalassobacillus pellis]MBM7554368.1 ABC-type multidrug transport system fused ATPase/permease subunit [Thalassobacillus pellis]
MLYSINLLQLLFRREDHLFKIKRAERLQNFWKWVVLLLATSILTYIWTSWVGLGMDPISVNATEFTRMEYEFRKAWFLIGRTAFALLLAIFVLFITSFVWWLFNNVPYNKLVIIQMNVLLVMLLERLTWIPLLVYAGVDWYVSPLSFGVPASYFTDIQWIIYIFGAISVFQLWIIWYQVRCLNYLSATKKHWIWFGVIFWHILLWAGTAALSNYDIFLLRIITS